MMAESGTRKVSCLKKDRISELPHNVQETILCFLPIQDAVRTSILSRAWKDRWTMIPHLVFDEEFADSMTRKYSQDDYELMTHKFACVINKALLLHNGPILKFSLVIPGDECCPVIIHEYIDQWFPLLSRNGIKQLILQDLNLEEVKAHHFSSLDLTHLRLLRVLFRYKPTFRRFTYLVKLELIDVSFDFVKSSDIFDCPVLEKLTLIICNYLFPNNFCAPKLKCLHQVYNYITSAYSLAGLENLKEYSCLLSGYDFMEDLIGETRTSNLVKIFDWVHKIEKLSIATMCKYLAAGGSPNRLPKPLPYLKTMNISDINFRDLSEVSCLLCLIRSAPNLCKLHISASWDHEGEDPNNYVIEDSEDLTLGHLEIVTFSYFEGLPAELELVKFLLAHSPLLKTMFIHHSEDMSEDETPALTVSEKMLKYSRSSSAAQISHLKHPVEIDEFDYELWSDVDISC